MKVAFFCFFLFFHFFDLDFLPGGPRWLFSDLVNATSIYNSDDEQVQYYQVHTQPTAIGRVYCTRSVSPLFQYLGPIRLRFFFCSFFLEMVRVGCVAPPTSPSYST
jgi:hypothetical protein